MIWKKTATGSWTASVGTTVYRVRPTPLSGGKMWWLYVSRVSPGGQYQSGSRYTPTGYYRDAVSFGTAKEAKLFAEALPRENPAVKILMGKPGDAGWYFTASEERDPRRVLAGPFASEQLARFFGAFYLQTSIWGQTFGFNFYTQAQAETIKDYPEEMGWKSLKFVHPNRLRYPEEFPWKCLKAKVDSGEWLDFF